MTVLKKMDDLVYASRLDRIVFTKIRPRSFRWLPFPVLATLIVGYAIIAGSPHSVSRIMIGTGIFYGGYMVATFLRIFGPRLVASGSQPLDERELMVKARASAISGIALTSLAMLGCFYMGIAGLLGLWHPDVPYDWTNLGFGIQALAMLLPTWIASWLEPRPLADQED